MVPLDLLVVPRHGIVGAAVVSSVVYSVNALVAFVIYLRVCKTSVRGYAVASWRRP